ncbi:putative pyridoxine 5'-phosphate oxidase superfamily flavin-nucleotide-binding protein [Neorhizobium huautlense]|uniref:Pyridoxine 5'-phosphate oxidase superfamily flavin-nucleotide-binding protein n=1 Tax=Neorhizobium huautlense TaxID=67774 RepID=A0ABT9Q183_9HYPH|nr:pyridoxamine 5'-phosphate oxidase family protein [Neorhizobium huautlense]MDP9840473.1 putative pyridoxine 5'-phosphate oxidase superfamily flavin-nucleotide-binding protein [Neorhizobium huautlense]
MAGADAEYSSDVAFTPAVKAIQARKGSRRAYAHMEEGGSWQTTIPENLKLFIESRISFYLATASADGQPYIQHRGGPPGFLKVLDEKTLGFADFAGNRQYVTQGNLTENRRVQLFLMDYAHRRRIKIWGTAEVIEDDADLIARLTPTDYNARIEQAIVISVSAWDVNCPQHIPQMFEASAVEAALAQKDRRIAELERELKALKNR